MSDQLQTCTYCGQECECYTQGLGDAQFSRSSALSERARIVAWLRDNEVWVRDWPGLVPDLIARGGHLESES